MKNKKKNHLKLIKKNSFKFNVTSFEQILFSNYFSVEMNIKLKKIIKNI